MERDAGIHTARRDRLSWTYRVILMGNRETGKTTLARPGASRTRHSASAGVAYQQTRGVNYTKRQVETTGVERPASQSRWLTRIAEQEIAPHYDVEMDVCEFGVATPEALQHLLEHDRGRGLANAYGIVFRLDNEQSYERVWNAWYPMVNKLLHQEETMAKHMSIPFLFLVGTHCDKLHENVQMLHRLRVESDLYERLRSSAFLYFQVDARSDIVDALWKQVACQLVNQHGYPSVLQSVDDVVAQEDNDDERWTVL